MSKSSLVGAFLVPGSALPLLRPETPPWQALLDGYKMAGERLQELKPDAIIVYSTAWIAVLDQLWLTSSSASGRHVDQTWHELGVIDYTINVDVDLAQACVAATAAYDIRSRPVDYDAFPIDPGTICANTLLNPDNRIPLVVTSNNVYHEWDKTMSLGRAAVESAAAQDKRVVALGVGGLSGSIFREGIDFSDDRLHSEADDGANRELLGLLEAADANALQAAIPGYAEAARADMGMKHLAFLLGACGDTYSGATVHGYGPQNGSGAAVVELTLDTVA